MSSGSRRDSSPRRRDSVSNKSEKLIADLSKKFENCKSLKIINDGDVMIITIDNKPEMHISLEMLPEDQTFYDLQDLIFDKIELSNKLRDFTYVNEYNSEEINYNDLFVNKNLKKLTLSHMQGISTSSQLGHIKELTLRQMYITLPDVIPDSLKTLHIELLDVEYEEQYTKIVNFCADKGISLTVGDLVYNEY